MAISFYPRSNQEVPEAFRQDCERMSLIAWYQCVLADPIEFHEARLLAFGEGPLPEDDDKLWHLLKPHLLNQ